MLTDILMKVLYIYLIVINAAAFLLMLIDKVKAKKNLWRIPEATLFLVAAIGGSIGSLLGMYTFRLRSRSVTPFQMRRVAPFRRARLTGLASAGSTTCRRNSSRAACRKGRTRITCAARSRFSSR